MPESEKPSGSDIEAPRRRIRPPRPPVPKLPTRAEELAEEIGEAILDGAFPPGMRLDEHRMAAHFEVSRTPVRDAIRLLHGTGLIEIGSKRSAFVRRLSPEEIAGLFTAMGEVEASCARLSALCMTEAEQAKLRSLHAHMGDLAKVGDHLAYVEANRAFHGLLYAGAHNPTLAEMAVSLRRRLTPYRTAQFRLAGRLSLSHKEHDRVVRAVMVRDGAKANASMLAHMSVVEEAFEAQDAPRAEERKPNVRQGHRAEAAEDGPAVSPVKSRSEPVPPRSGR